MKVTIAPRETYGLTEDRLRKAVDTSLSEKIRRAECKTRHKWIGERQSG